MLTDEPIVYGACASVPYCGEPGRPLSKSAAAYCLRLMDGAIAADGDDAVCGYTMYYGNRHVTRDECETLLES